MFSSLVIDIIRGGHLKCIAHRQFSRFHQVTIIDHRNLRQLSPIDLSSCNVLNIVDQNTVFFHAYTIAIAYTKENPLTCHNSRALRTDRVS